MNRKATVTLTDYRHRSNATAAAYHVDPAMESVVDFIVSDDRVAPSSHLYSCQGIAIDVIILNQTATFSKYVYATLMSVVYLVFPAQEM